MKWTYNEKTGLIKDSEGYIIADLGINQTDTNGLLLASAPELLAALEKILAKYLNDRTSYGMAAMDIAKDAIAKAKGGEPK